MSTTNAYVGDIGTQIYMDTGEDISAANSVSIKVKKRSGATDTWVGSVDSTTKVLYTTEAGDLDEAGTYKIQAYVDLPSWQGHSDTKTMTVRSLFN